MQTDVQLMAVGVLLDLPGQKTVTISHQTFDELALQVAEAALNKKGRTYITCRTSEVRTGDVILGLQVTDARHDDNGSHVNISFGSDNTLHQSRNYMLTVERPIS